jgi:8-oxo-dGTP diphosphatase
MPEEPALVVRAVLDLIDGIEPLDSLESAHLADAKTWLASTTDVFRRTRQPAAPPKHLVSYFLAIDPEDGDVLLGDHVTSGLWLPSGGHVERGEHPVETVRRECEEELGVQAHFLAGLGERPLFLTVTDTVDSAKHRHTDVSLWFVIEIGKSAQLAPDPREYRSVRWWTPADVQRSTRSLFDPHQCRMLAKLGSVLTPPAPAPAPAPPTRGIADV